MEIAKRETFPLRLELRVKNAQLIKAREELGLTLKEAAERIGISHGFYSSCECMQIYPSPETQTKICEFYRNSGVFILEEDVFPPELKKNKPEKKYVTDRDMPLEMLSLSDPAVIKQLPAYNTTEEEVYRGEFLQLVSDVVRTLNPREQRIIRMRYGLEPYKTGHSLEEVGDNLHICPERVRQLEKKAIKKLKHPSKARLLRLLFEA